MKLDENSIYEFVIDIGVDEFLVKNGYYEIHCKKNDIYKIKKKLEFKVKNFISTEIEWIPSNLISLETEFEKEVLDFLNILEDDDDVQKVYANISFKVIANVYNRN